MRTHRSSCLPGPTLRSRTRWHQQESTSPRPEDACPLPEVAKDDDPAFRADLVARIRRQIADGTYGTEQQWEIALDRLLRHLDQMG